MAYDNLHLVLLLSNGQGPLVVIDIPIPVVNSEFLFLKTLQYGVKKPLHGHEENNL
jgi:hypothetical protein